MHGIGLEEDVCNWVDMRVPKTTVSRNKIGKALAAKG